MTKKLRTIAASSIASQSLRRPDRRGAMDPSSQKPTAAGNGSLPVPANSGGANINTPASMPIANSGSASADPLDVHKLNLSQTINSIEKTLGLLHQLNLTVSSFNVAAQLPLLKRL
ncbi:Mediator of RNA polymerase II transcription subunit 10b [Platanthera zijinensis]|uniref:Mediator of RNA polymerase II transcription subunit 10b n=1 Tax=Platanthera zijinensis TaxID=2320716 RepID=A0AAP0BIM2_9ASPA